MPYEGEFANKTSHSEFLKNPEVSEFLKQCTYLTPPSDEECQAIADRFVQPPVTDKSLPSFVIAIDGSNYEASIDDKLPSTKIGYIKIGAVLIDLEQYGSLRDGKYVDPFRVASLQKNNTPLTFSIPSSNIRWGNKTSVGDSFRAILDSQFYGVRTRFVEDDPTTSLRSTLFYLASKRPGELGTNNIRQLKMHRCPNCGNGPVEVSDIPDQQYCSFCNGEVYPTDCLRIWEEVQDFQSNQVAISRIMSVLEHLIPMHYMLYLARQAFLNLSGMAFFIDGPLAEFGNAAWLHRSIMIFIQEVNKRLARHNQLPLIMIGLQKTGQVVDHINLIDRFLPNNRIFAINDEYRYKYILAGREEARNGFGYETYFGQDFIYKTPTGRSFVFALPYPYDSKDVPNFIQEKTKFENYPQLALAIKLINHLESDLYQNAVVPIALAHRYTAISLEPGGKVLDLLTRKSLNG